MTHDFISVRVSIVEDESWYVQTDQSSGDLDLGGIKNSAFEIASVQQVLTVEYSTEFYGGGK